MSLFRSIVFFPVDRNHWGADLETNGWRVEL